MSKLVVHGIHIPLPCDGDERGVKLFITPFWHFVLEFYPEWLKKVREQGKTLWPVQPYFLEVCKALERLEARPGQNQAEWGQRYFQHFGIDHFGKYATRYKGMAD